MIQSFWKDQILKVHQNCIHSINEISEQPLLQGQCLALSMGARLVKKLDSAMHVTCFLSNFCYSRLRNKRAGMFINFWVLFQQAWTLFLSVYLLILEKLQLFYFKKYH